MAVKKALRCAAIAVLLSLAGALAFLAYMVMQARSDPIVRDTTVHMERWPADSRPVKALLWSDLHLLNRATNDGRFRRIIEQVRALRPDIILITGDFLSDNADRWDDAIAALSALRTLHPPLGIIGVLGNHDHKNGPERLRRALARYGVEILSNGAVRRGPLTIGGMDDMVTAHAAFSSTFRATKRLGGPMVLLSHTPDVAPFMPQDLPLLLAGHTHCGQIVLPWYGPLREGSSHGPRYRCGRIEEAGRTIIVTAGTGTSLLSFRLNAPPDLWLITLER